MNVDEVIASTSKHLVAADMKGRPPARVTISDVVLESLGQGEEAEKKIVVYFKGANKGLVLNTINLLTIKESLGVETNDWIGHVLEIYHDPTVMYAGKRSGGIRCRVHVGPNRAPATKPAPVKHTQSPQHAAPMRPESTDLPEPSRPDPFASDPDILDDSIPF